MKNKTGAANLKQAIESKKRKSMAFLIVPIVLLALALILVGFSNPRGW